MHLPEARSFTPPPSGAHRAICVGFIDCGTQKSEYKGQVSTKRVVQIRWELCDEQMDDGRPFVAVKRYNWSMSDKATLRGDLESWRGKPFEKADFGPGGFDTRRLLGVPAMLTITHKDNNGQTYANITAISPLPKSMERPGKSANTPVYLALEKERFDKGVFESLSDKMKELISHSPEYQEIVHGVKREEPNGDPRGDVPLDDEIPF